MNVMQPKYIKGLLAAMLVMMVSAFAHAAPEEGGPAASCGEDALEIATGAKGKGYSLLYANLEKVCGQVVPMCEHPTNGGLDNVNALSVKEADLGFAQLDTASSMKSDENIAALVSVATLNTNFMHTVVSSSGFNVPGPKKWGGMKDGDPIQVQLRSFSDLKGRTIGAVGSADLLIRQLNKQLGYNMTIRGFKSDADAIQAMKNPANIVAFVTVSGWPHGALKNLTPDSGLTLASFDAVVAAPYIVKPLNYRSMAVYNSNTLGVPNLLLARQFTGEKAAQVSKLRACMASSLTKLQQGKFEPGWNEMKSLDGANDWPKFVPSSAAAPRKK